MPQCPFCKGQTPEDLLRFGGHCPHCLNEIPGEEAATDPGAQARQRQELEARAAAARLQRRSRVVRAAAVLVALIGVGSWFALHEDPAPLILDDVEVYIAPASEHRNLAAEEAAAAKAKAEAEEEAHRKEMARRAAAAAAASSGGGSGDLASAGPAPMSPGGSSSGGSSSGGSSSGGSGGASDSLSGSMVGLDLNPKGPSARSISGLVASGDAEIKSMAKTVVDANYKQLRQCYESRLKENPSLEGRWVLAWTIEKDGTVSKAEAEGQGVKDRTFESCMERNVKNWHFQSVSKSTELARAFVFSN